MVKFCFYEAVLLCLYTNGFTEPNVFCVINVGSFQDANHHSSHYSATLNSQLQGKSKEVKFREQTCLG